MQNLLDPYKLRHEAPGATYPNDGGDHSFTTTNDGHALIIYTERSGRPILITTPTIHNKGTDGAGAGAEDIDWTLYVADRETTDPNDSAWIERDSGTITAGESPYIPPASTGHRAVMLVVTPAVDGTQSDGVEMSLGAAV